MKTEELTIRIQKAKNFLKRSIDLLKARGQTKKAEDVENVLQVILILGG